MFSPAATNEFGVLRCVAMRYAGDFTRVLGGDDVHPVLVRQMTTSTWSQPDVSLVRTQQDALIALLRSRDIEVMLLDQAPGCSVQHYPRDLGFVIDSTLFLARLNSEHRQPEAAALARLAADVPNVARLSAGTIEGGDVMLHTGSVLVGRSEETSSAGIDALQDALGEAGIDREVIPVPFAVPGIVHLDDHFNIVAPGIALIHAAVFARPQRRWFEQNFDPIHVTDDEARGVQVNVLAIAPGTVVVAEGSERISGELRERGVEVLAVDYSEVTRVPGSLRCTTLPLTRG
ncbi:N-Dimethylarginine dimethylaminohydrolase [Amycolatopsis saalfeldensis]|uniref:N-Dimethylarginine dimethylaminohydrolase n=2 Tax=Amycolatopsis saalfeldensis TaxID=394193 RepID=A0A1H8YNF9_9PSEU|nr:N-Dimethylarginine dimethylaminohydrolase [Amycolatopsis saalfeldensis]